MERLLKRPGLAVAIGVLLLAVALAACGAADEAQQDDNFGNAVRDEGEGAAPAEQDSAGAENADPGSAPSVQGITERKITRNATLRLSVEDIPATIQQVEDIAAAEGGFVSASEVRIDPDAAEDEQNASIKIRVPAEAYTRVIRQLRELAVEVDSESSQATEVTDEYTDLQARLRNLQATEQRYLDLLARAQTVDEILAVQDRVNSTRLEIEQVQGRINVLNDLTDMATITVELRLPPLSVRGDDKGWAEDALSTSWETTKDALMVLGTVAIASAFILPWILIGTLVAGLGWRLFGRRVSDALLRLYRM